METVLVPAPPSLQDAYSNQPITKQTSPPRAASSSKVLLSSVRPMKEPPLLLNDAIDHAAALQC